MKILTKIVEFKHNKFYVNKTFNIQEIVLKVLHNDFMRNAFLLSRGIKNHRAWLQVRSEQICAEADTSSHHCTLKCVVIDEKKMLFSGM